MNQAGKISLKIMILPNPFVQNAITSLPWSKLFTAASCSCLKINNFAIFMKNIRRDNAFRNAFSTIFQLRARYLRYNQRWFQKFWLTCLASDLIAMARTPANGTKENVGNPGRRFLSCLSPRFLEASVLVYTPSPLSQRAKIAKPSSHASYMRGV